MSATCRRGHDQAVLPEAERCGDLTEHGCKTSIGDEPGLAARVGGDVVSLRLTPADLPRFLSLEEAAAYFGLDRTTLRKVLESQGYQPMGRKWRIPSSRLDDIALGITPARSGAAS